MPDESSTYTPGTFAYIEQKIRDAAVGTEFGADFEWLCRFFLLTEPKYKGAIKSVWHWNDWPGRWRRGQRDRPGCANHGWETLGHSSESGSRRSIHS